MSQLVERYAVALFELAQENECVVKWQTQANLMSLSIPKESTVFFQSSLIEKEEKKEVLKKAFSTTVDGLLLNFMLLLIDKNRFQYINGILDKFNKLCNQFRKIEEGIIYSARPFTENQIQEIEKAFSLQRGNQCALINKIDERLISGFKVMVENEVIDLSMKKSIESMKYELLKETR
ncbi:MAG: ATP synthase F1 subunit delta [Anaerorhabdus sp.]